ncbi:ABC transporter permease [Geodermatophilus marinus]|nr:ABC transporter permease [Geodermatophilus sp. LHW52908]
MAAGRRPRGRRGRRRPHHPPPRGGRGARRPHRRAQGRARRPRRHPGGDRRDPAGHHPLHPRPGHAGATGARRRRGRRGRPPRRLADPEPAAGARRAPGLGRPPRRRPARPAGPRRLAGAGVPRRRRRRLTTCRPPSTHPPTDPRPGEETAPVTTPTAPAGPSRARRIAALVGAETRLLLRNRTALVNSVALPLLLVAFVPLVGDVGGRGLVGTAVVVTLVFLTYYNLVTTYVARREDLVLQRLRTGELSGPEVLLATAVPTLLVTAGQVVLLAAGIAVLGRWTAPVDVVLPLLAVVLGAALMVVLATASTLFTRTPESAQITTLPVVVGATALSGLFFPLTALPEALATVARLLPLTPVVELLQLGLAGRTWDGAAVAGADLYGAALVPLAVLVAWLLGAGALTARAFRWAPRR